MKEPLLEEKATGGLAVPESMVYLVYMTMFIDTLAACISTPVMPYYAQSFGVSIEWIGYLYGAWSFCSTVFAPMLSGMSDKWGRKFVLVTCLVGAGFANIIQGSAIYAPSGLGFMIFLFGRGFSGCWASVGATCNVYISDVAPESIRGPYLQKLSMVPIVALLLGPGLGGATATAFGNNVPIMVDGIITLFSACVVMRHMVETPAFLQLQRANSEKDPEKASASSASPGQTKVPDAVHIVGVGAFLGAIASSSNLATFSLFYQQKYGLIPLYIGFVFIMVSVSMLLSNMIIVPQLTKKLSPTQSMFIGSSISGSFIICLGLSQTLPVSLASMFLATVGGAINASQQSTVVASFSDASNRGKIFGLLQTYSNTGRIIGPIMATHIAGFGIGRPFLVSGVCTFCAAVVYLNVARFADLTAKDKPKDAQPALQRRASAYGDEWQDESGNPEDVARIGNFMADLLTKRHYKWVSRREDIENLLENALPELCVGHRDCYVASFEAVQQSKANSLSIVEQSNEVI